MSWGGTKGGEKSINQKQSKKSKKIIKKSKKSKNQKINLIFWLLAVLKKNDHGTTHTQTDTELYIVRLIDFLTLYI